ncbi:hypothetical protein FRC09_011531 [Ceratobasidium sp. 395]|nr:hypothetical protein FRC09_011531 [Ceratobasidium sp. 395]
MVSSSSSSLPEWSMESDRDKKIATDSYESVAALLPTKTIAKPKKRKTLTKKTPTEPAPSELRRCIVCLEVHPGSVFLPLDCPLLTNHSRNIVDFVDQRVTDLVAAQGPKRESQWLISRLRDWLKEQAKEVEARGSSG